jgi:hypothetical protein
MPKSKHRRRKGQGKAIKRPGRGKGSATPLVRVPNDHLSADEYFRRLATNWLAAGEQKL